MPSSIVRKAVVPVAGFGTSFLPETKTMPKAMLPIVDIPAIQFVIEEITKSGIEEIPPHQRPRQTRRRGPL